MIEQSYRRRLSIALTGRKLFLKIFLWFWLTVLGILASIYLVPRLSDVRIISPPNLNAAMAPILAAQVVRVYKAEGATGFARFARENVDANGRKLYLLDGMYQDVLGRPVPENGVGIAKVARAGQLVIYRSETAAYRYIADDGQPYIFLLYLGGRMDKLTSSGTWRGWPYYALVLMVVTLPCYWLAWHIAGPILMVQNAARQVSQGDLQARAPMALLKRHDEMRDLTHDFNVMVNRIEVLVNTQKRLLASVSHETRSPLTRLGLATALLRRHELPETTALLDRLDREVATLDVLMGQLLTLSRLESGVHQARLDVVDLGTLLEEVVADATFESGPEQDLITLDIAQNARLEQADSVALRSALDNVLRNSLRYSPLRSPIKVTLHCESDGTSTIATVKVCDRGPGVPEEHLEAIFRPFFRVTSTLQDAPSGNGLGLTIAAEAIHLHGGRIHARNRTNGGLEVDVVLPLRHVATAP